MTLNLSVDEVLTTTRSVRKRLDMEKPVSKQVLLECLELATQGFQRSGLAMGLRRGRGQEEDPRRHLPQGGRPVFGHAEAGVRRG
jgi:hypothetical protein